MKSQVGMEEIYPGSSSEDCYQLLKGIYGLCQAARQFWKKFLNTVKQEPCGFQVSPADPCMLFKENELGVCIIIMCVDDMLIIGKKEQIQDFASKIQKEFSVKIQHNLADYLGCEFHMNKERTRGWLGQLSTIKSLEQKFGDRAMKERLSLTPGTPSDMIYIKTQVFRLLRYYSPTPSNIARSDWVTQNITHNMTSSIIQPYGLHSL